MRKEITPPSTVPNLPAPPAQATLRILRLSDVCEMTGLRRSWIYELEAGHRFPQRIKLGLRAVGWIESEVQEWLAERIAQSRSEPEP